MAQNKQPNAVGMRRILRSSLDVQRPKEIISMAAPAGAVGRANQTLEKADKERDKLVRQSVQRISKDVCIQVRT